MNEKTQKYLERLTTIGNKLLQTRAEVKTLKEDAEKLKIAVEDFTEKVKETKPQKMDD